MAYNSAYTGPQVDEAVGAVRTKASTWDDKQDKLSGTEDQIVGFNSAGEAVPVAAPNPLPSGGTAGQVLTKTEDGEAWQDPPSGLPDGGTEGQILYQGESGPEWKDESPAVFLVTMTNKIGDKFTADKTFDEIEAAYASGNVIQLYIPNNSLVASLEVYIPKTFFVFSNTAVLQQYGESSTVYSLSKSTFTITPAENVALIKRVGLASGLYFDNSENGFVSDTVQGAIEEVNDKIPTDYVHTTRTINNKPLSSDVTLTAEDVGAGEPATSTTITLTTSGWTGSAAPYYQQVSCSIVAADTAVVAVDVDTPGTDADADAEAINAWALCTQQNPTQGAGTLTFYCTEMPTINIPVKVGVS